MIKDTMISTSSVGKDNPYKASPLATSPVSLVKAMIEKDKFKENLPKLSSQVNNADKLLQVINEGGITGEMAEWVMGMSMLETGNLTSNPTKWYNYSNIAYTKNSPYQSGKGYKDWAAYRSPVMWAKDMKRVLSLKNVKSSQGNGGPAAIEATNLKDFIHRLKVNGYFGNGNEDVYRRGVDMIVRAKKEYKGNVADYEQATGTKVDVKAGTITDAAGWWKSLLWYEKGGIIALGVILAKKALD